MPSIRVLVVDDSALIRQMLTRALSMDPRVEVVGTARNGVEAIERTRDLEPDVVTLDIEMPELTGLEALPHIHRHSEARVVMLSAVDDPDTTYRALSLGAVDFIPKPHAGMASSMTELTEVLLKKIKTAYRISPEKAATVRAEAVSATAPTAATATHRGNDELLACVGLAASTGGPPALERVISGLTPQMPAAYLITQHLPAGFSASLARRLDAVGDIKVVEAEDALEIVPAHAYVAPYGGHMRIERAAGAVRIRLTEEPPLHGVRPAADPMFDSIAQVFGDRAVGVVLSGMGSDGAAGAASIRGAGGEVIAQDEATSVVWGMPGAAVRSQAANRIVSVGLVAAEIRRAVRVRVGEDYSQ